MCGCWRAAEYRRRPRACPRSARGPGRFPAARACHVSDEILPPAAASWLRARSGAARLIEVAVLPMNGGAVARRVERLDVSMGSADGSLCTLALVRKWGTTAETTALAAAQAVRPAARAIPELVASGRDGQGRWMISPFYAGHQAGTGAPRRSCSTPLAACTPASGPAGRT